MEVKYKVVGKYTEGRQIVAYHLVSTDESKSGPYNKEQLYKLIKSGCVINCTAQMYQGKMLFRGKGIKLDNLPSKQLKGNTIQLANDKKTEIKQTESKQEAPKQEINTEELPKTKKVYLVFKRFAPSEGLHKPITENFNVGNKDYVTDLRLVCDDADVLERMYHKITDRSFHTTYKYGMPRFEDNPEFIRKIYKSSDFKGWYSMVGDNNIEYIHTIEEWMKLIGNLSVKILVVKEYITESGFKVSAGTIPANKLGKHPDFEKFNLLVNNYSYDGYDYYDDD